MREPSKSKSRMAPHRIDEGRRTKSPAPSQTLTDTAVRLLAALGLSTDHAARKSTTER